MLTNSRRAGKLSALETEVIDMFVGLAQALGLPRSMGQIYGLLYLAPQPLAMDQIVDTLQISMGSASQGLRHLRAFGAVRVSYLNGQRKDFFTAETELRTILTGYYEAEIKQRVETTEGRFPLMRELAAQTGEKREHYTQRLDKLERWHGISRDLLETLTELLPPHS